MAKRKHASAAYLLYGYRAQRIIKMVLLHMKAKHLSQKGLADLAHFNDRYFTGWQSGKRPIGQKHLQAMCEILGLDEEQLLLEQFDRSELVEFLSGQIATRPLVSNTAQ